MKKMRCTLRKSLVAICIMALLCPMINLQNAQAATKPKLNKTSITMTDTGKNYTVKVSGVKKKDKVKWSVKDNSYSGKCIKVVKKNKKSITVRALKNGNGKITCKVGKKKLACKFTVKLSDNTKTNSSYSYYYQKLWDYIDENGESDGSGETEITTDDVSDMLDDPYINYMSLSYTNMDRSSIWGDICLSVDSDDDDITTYAYLMFNKDGTVEIDIDMDLNYESVIETETVNFDPADYRKGDRVHFKVTKNPYDLSNDDIQDNVNEILPDMLELFDTYLQSEVGFGIRELGFTNYR